MTCEEFTRTLDEQGAPTPAAAEHARGCAACRRELERWSAVRAQLHAMRGEEPPPFLHARVMAHVEAARAERAVRAARLSWLRPAVAGPLLVLALAAGLGGVQVWRRLAAPEREEAGGVVGESRPLETGSRLDPGPRGDAAPEAAKSADAQSARLGEDRARDEALGRIANNEVARPAPEQPASPHPSAPPPAAPVAALRAESGTASTGGAGAEVSAAAAEGTTVGFREERAKAVPAEVRMAAQSMPRPASVACRVETEDGTPAGTAELTPDDCPAGPPARMLVVAENGTMVLLDLTAQTSKPPSPAGHEALRDLVLRPGRYRLVPVVP